MSRKPPSSRDVALIRRLRDEYGVEVSARQLRTWRDWRGVGLIPRPRRVRGFKASLAESLPAAEIERVAAVARLVARLRSLDLVALVLAARWCEVQSGALRAVLLDTLDALEADARRPKHVDREYRRLSRVRKEEKEEAARLSTVIAAGLRRFGVHTERVEALLFRRDLFMRTPNTREFLGHRAAVLLRAQDPPAGLRPGAAVTFAEARATVEAASAEEVVLAVAAAWQRASALGFSEAKAARALPLFALDLLTHYAGMLEQAGHLLPWLGGYTGTGAGFSEGVGTPRAAGGSTRR